MCDVKSNSLIHNIHSNICEIDCREWMAPLLNATQTKRLSRSKYAKMAMKFNNFKQLVDSEY